MLSDGRRVNRLAGSVLSCSILWVSVQTSHFTDVGLGSTYDNVIVTGDFIALDFDHGDSVVLSWFQSLHYSTVVQLSEFTRLF